MVKDFLELIRGGRVPRGAEVLAAVPADYVAHIEAASRLEWIDAVPIARTADLARDLAGPARWRALHRAQAEEMTMRPLFRAIFAGMRAVFGATPEAPLRLFPTLIAQAHRNYGPVVFEPEGDCAARVCFPACPPAGLSRGLLEVFAGTLEGIMERRAPGVAAVVDYAAGDSSAAIRVAWNAGSSG